MAQVQQAAGEVLIAALEQGTLSLEGQFLPGSNYTFLVQVEHEGVRFPAVYKPMRGEQPLWDFPPASLAGREAAAWRVSEMLGWKIVPATVLRDGPFGPGSLQQYVAYDPGYHYFTFTPADLRRLDVVALFDLLVNNADRKGSHVLFESGTQRLYAIDHGLCFHAEEKLRTVIWNFAGEALPEARLADLRNLQERRQEVRAALRDLLLAPELEALEMRLERLLKEPVFPPMPRQRRAFPYPPL